jgi:hypothetical protein
MFLLPQMIDRDKVTAQLQHGILMLWPPGRTGGKPKRIPVMDAQGGPTQR